MNASKVRFRNHRIRFQRLADAKLFNGWLCSLSHTQAIIDIPEGLGVLPGEVCRFEVFGKGVVASFEGCVDVVTSGSLSVRLTSVVRILPSGEDARIRVPELFARVSRIAGPDAQNINPLETLAWDATVLDISAKGLGFITQVALQKGDFIRLDVAAGRGTATCTGQVRYCKAEGSSFRIGALVLQMDRLSRVVFETIINQAA